MKRRTLALLLLALLAVGTLLPACGGAGEGDAPTPVGGTVAPDDNGGGGTDSNGDAKPTAGPTATHTSAQLGAPVTVGDYTIALDSAAIADDVLKVAVTVDNTKNSGVVSLPGTAFEAYAPDSTRPMDVDLLCTDLAGKVDAGQTLKGNLCWKAAGATATKGISVHYLAGRDALLSWDLP